jgi:hypothetical protein
MKQVELETCRAEVMREIMDMISTRVRLQVDDNIDDLLWGQARVQVGFRVKDEIAEQIK